MCRNWLRFHYASMDTRTTHSHLTCTLWERVNESLKMQNNKSCGNKKQKKPTRQGRKGLGFLIFKKAKDDSLFQTLRNWGREFQFEATSTALCWVTQQREQTTKVVELRGRGKWHNGRKHRGKWREFLPWREAFWNDLSRGRSVLSYMRWNLAAEWKSDDRKAELETWGRWPGLEGTGEQSKFPDNLNVEQTRENSIPTDGSGLKQREHSGHLLTRETVGHREKWTLFWKYKWDVPELNTR